MGPLFINISISGKESVSGELKEVNMYIHQFDITKTLETTVCLDTSPMLPKVTRSHLSELKLKIPTPD